LSVGPAPVPPDHSHADHGHVDDSHVDDRHAGNGDRPPLFGNLAADGRFRRDSWWGRLLHPRTVSYREARATDSLHLVVNGDKVSVHLDRFSPLAVQGSGTRRRYAPVRMVAHGLVDVAGEAVGLLRGHRHHPHELTCERIWVDDDPDGDDGPGTDEGHTDHDAPCDPEGECVPFNAADEAVHLLDSQTEPWSVHIEAMLNGRVDDERLRTAIAQAVARHPLARARRAPFHWSDHQFQWQVDPTADADALDVVDCPDAPALNEAREAFEGVSVPLAGSPPLRVLLAHHPGGDVVMLNASHAATDGVGALRFLRSIARAYAGAADPVPDLDLLAARNLSAGLAGADVPTRVRRRLAVADQLRDLVVPPTRIAVDGATDGSGYGFRLVSLSAAETEVLMSLDHPGTVNDLLLAALNLAVDRWNAGHGMSSGRIGVLVPANLRPAAWSQEVVGNFTLMARVSTGRRDRASRTATLAAVTTQTRRKKRTGLGTAMAEVLGASPLLPLWAKQAMSPLMSGIARRLADTAVCSNLGRVDEPVWFGPEIGDASSVHVSTPARMPCGVSIGVITTGGRMHLTFRHRHPQFDDPASARFVDGFLSELADLVDDVRG